MNLLRDTHAFIWFTAGAPELSPRAKSLIEDPNNNRFLSIASLWEMAIKSSLGKLTLPTPIDQFAAQYLPLNMTTLLPIGIADVAAVAQLPMHHRDPFDRLLLSQAKVHQLTFVSADSRLDVYNVPREW